jgi:hypothetical protein
MATRMQQRRGTAAQWTAANPVLAAGEIGFETDTSKFKMGNGSSTWSALEYFANASELAALVNGAPGLLDTLDELAQAVGDDPQFYLTIGQTVTNHTNASTMVHGIADTSALATLTDVNNAATGAASDLSDHTSATTTVHGIADTSLLATTADVQAAESAASSALGAHEALTQSVHGIADTSLLATTADVQAAESSAASALGAHEALTENVHGIVNTADLATLSDLTDAISGATVDQSALAGEGIDWNALTEQFDIDSTVATKTYADNAVTDHNTETENVHGIANTALLATTANVATAKGEAIDAAAVASENYTDAAVAALTKSSVGLANVDNTSDADKPVSTATQTALDAKASLSGATFTGSVEIDQNLTVDGNLTINGTTFSASATSITIEDNMVQLAHENAANTVDLGLVVAYNDGSAKHAGIVRDVSDAKWKLFKGVATEPTTTVAFGEGSLDDLAVGALEVTTVTASSGVVFSDGTQTKEGVPSRTPISQKTASYTLSSLSERDTLIEFDSTSAVTISIPTDAQVDYPIGTTLDILQTNTGQVTVAAGTPATTTVNATPGLKLRTRWSSATLLKRAANTWVVYGDLTA